MEKTKMDKNKKSRSQLIRDLVNTSDKELEDEELMHMLISESFSSNTNENEKATLGQTAADSVARFAGSWAFIFSFMGVMVLWMVINTLMAANAFDGYPFILLNLVLSCIAAIQAPLIMMSQNRQESKDRNRAENDYRINLKSEIIIDDLHRKLDTILENQKKLTNAVNKLSSERSDI